MGKNFREWTNRSDRATICQNCSQEVPKGVMITRVGRGKYAHKFYFECGRELIPNWLLKCNREELREIYTRLKGKIAIENWDIEGWTNYFSSKEVIASIDEFRSKPDFAGIINLLDPERILFTKSEFMAEVETHNLSAGNSRGSHYGFIDWFVRFHGSWVNQYLFSVAFELDGLSHARIISKPTDQVISTSPDGAYVTLKRYNCIDLNELAEYKAICRLLENLGNEEYFTDCMHYVEQCTGAKSKIVRTIVDMAKTGRIDMDPHEHKDGYFIRGYRYLDPESLTPIDFRTNLN